MRKLLWFGLGIIAVLAVLIVIAAVAGSKASPKPAANPAPVQAAPAPAVPAGPTPGTVLGTWSGTGNQNTPAFTEPPSGDYTVSWSYSGNTDPTLGAATNFIVSDTDSSGNSFGLPNDVQSSGSGSTEITGATGGTDSFNIEATGSWTIKVVADS